MILLKDLLTQEVDGRRGSIRKAGRNSCRTEGVRLVRMQRIAGQWQERMRRIQEGVNASIYKGEFVNEPKLLKVQNIDKKIVFRR